MPSNVWNELWMSIVLPFAQTPHFNPSRLRIGLLISDSTVATTIHCPLHDPQRPLYGSAWCTTISCHLLSALSTSFACCPSCPHMSSPCRRCQPVTRSCHRFSAPKRRCRHCRYRYGRRRAGFMQTRSRHQDIRLLCHSTHRRWADGLREECSSILA